MRVAVDAVVFAVRADKEDTSARPRLHVALIERALDPDKGKWALPGGFVREDEDIEAAVRRELGSEAGVTGAKLEQLRTYGAVQRDARGRVLSVAYFALIRPTELRPGSDAERAQWFAIDRLPKLAFDHAAIIRDATERLQNKIEYTDLAFALMPKHFTLARLQELYEEILRRDIDKSNFRKRMLDLGVVEAVGRTAQPRGLGRPAQLYRFVPRALRRHGDLWGAFAFARMRDVSPRGKR